MLIFFSQEEPGGLFMPLSSLPRRSQEASLCLFSHSPGGARRPLYASFLIVQEEPGGLFMPFFLVQEEPGGLFMPFLLSPGGARRPLSVSFLLVRA